MSPKITRVQAKRAFRYLKRGVFPPEGITLFTVGRSREFKIFDKALGEVAQGTSRHFFLQASYGYGKSHMLKAIESYAQRSNFAVAQVIIDGYEHAFNHPTRYLHSLLGDLCVPEISFRGLSCLVRFWLNSNQRQSLLHWAKNFAPWDIHYAISNIRSDNSFHYYKRLLECRHLQGRNGRGYYPLVYEKINVLANICRAIGLKGIVLLFDEVETISTLLTNIRSRILSYEILNKFSDSRSFPNCCFVFAITPDFGFKIQNEIGKYLKYEDEYPEGLRFITRWLKNDCNVLELRRLTKTENESLCLTLRILHEFAYSWSTKDCISDSFIKTFVDEAERYSLNQREIIKSFVNILEVCQQNPTCNASHCLFPLEEDQPEDKPNTTSVKIIAIEEDHVLVSDKDRFVLLSIDDFIDAEGYFIVDVGQLVEIPSEYLDR